MWPVVAFLSMQVKDSDEDDSYSKILELQSFTTTDNGEQMQIFLFMLITRATLVA